MQEYYFLSGVVEFGYFSDNKFLVPDDRDLATTSRSEACQALLKRVPLAECFQSRPDSPSGAPVHMEPWRFVEQFIGREAETHLGLLIHALQDRYHSLLGERFGVSGWISRIRG